MVYQKSIAVIICYFGKLPWYFDLFSHSCKFNSSVDFFIITDDTTYVKELPSNIKLVYNTLSELSIIASEKLGFPVDIKEPYKLCDFKPTYGLLFPELIANYDFWGYGDIDVIFGNIRKFITDNILEEHDIISVRHDFLTGYFLLLKNTEKMLKLFTNSKDYQKVLSSHEHFCFDETNFMHQPFTDEIPYYLIKTEVESMTHVVYKMREADEIRPYFDYHVVEGIPGNIKWVEGHVYYKDKYEAILYHLILLKKIFTPKKTIEGSFEQFKVSSSKMYSFKKIVKKIKNT